MIRKGYRYLLTAVIAASAAALLTFAARNDFGLGRNMEITVNMMRELSLSYTLPALARERLRITLSLIANNVLMLHNEAPFDPELTSNTGTYYQGFDYFMPPSLRSWGFGVKVNF